MSQQEPSLNEIYSLKQKQKAVDQAKDNLIDLLSNQLADLVLMSKIELGDDVIIEIMRLKNIIYEK